MRPRSLAPLFLSFVLLTSGPAAGFPLAVGTWRCGARVVGVGRTMGDVYAICGEPTERTATTELVTVRVSYDVTVTRAVAIETWIYDRGPHQFVRALTFRDDVLVAIDEGSYGN